MDRATEAVYSFFLAKGFTKSAKKLLSEISGAVAPSAANDDLLNAWHKKHPAPATSTSKKDDSSSSSSSSDSSDSDSDDEPAKKSTAPAKSAVSESKEADSDSSSSSDSDNDSDSSSSSDSDSGVKVQLKNEAKGGSSSDSSSSSDSDDSDSDSDSSDDEAAAEANTKRIMAERARKATEAAAAAAAWQPSSPTLDRKKSGEKRKSGEAFRRVDSEEWSKEIITGLEDNSYEQTFGGAGYGAKASEKLITVRGKDFRHEKTKKKRGSYRGGEISLAVNGFKYEDE